MESDDGAAVIHRESTEGKFNHESEVEQREEETMENRNTMTENIPDCSMEPAKSNPLAVSPSNETGDIDNLSTISEETVIEVVGESLKDLNVEDKDLPKSSPEIMSDVNGNTRGSATQNEASSQVKKIRPLCVDPVNNEAHSVDFFPDCKPTKLRTFESDSKDLVSKHIIPHFSDKDGQTNQPEPKTLQDHVLPCLGEFAKPVVSPVITKRESRDEKLQESDCGSVSTSSFVSEMMEPSTSTRTDNHNCLLNNFAFHNEKFQFLLRSTSKPSFSSTCLLNPRAESSSNVPYTSTPLMFGEHVPNKAPAEPTFVSKNSCAAHFDNKLILPAASRDSAFCDFKKEVENIPNKKSSNQAVKTGNILDSRSCLAQKGERFSQALNTIKREKDKHYSASSSSGSWHETAVNCVSNNCPDVSSASLKTVASEKGTESTIPVYSSAPQDFSFQDKTGVSSFSNLSRGEFSLSQSYGKLSFQPLTTHSINFPISCSRTESDCPELTSEQTNSPLSVENSSFTCPATEKGKTDSSKTSCSFGFSSRGHSGKKVNNYDEHFWNALCGKNVKNDARRADSEAALFGSASNISIKKTKELFSFHGKESEASDKNTLHKPFSFTSLFPTLQSPQPEKISSARQSSPSNFQQPSVSTSASVYQSSLFSNMRSPSPPERNSSAGPSTAALFQAAPVSTPPQPVSFEKNFLNFNFRPTSSVSVQAENDASSRPKSSVTSSDGAVLGSYVPGPTVFIGPATFPSIIQSNSSPHHTRKSRKCNKLSKTSTKLPLKEKVTFQFCDTGIGPVPFRSVIGNDVVVTNGSATTYVIRYQHISCMEEYKSASPEELRFNYYAKKNAPFSDHFFTFCAGPDSNPFINPDKIMRSVDCQTDEGGKSPCPKVPLQEVWRALECPVCLDVVLPPVYQCEQGHHACSSCWNKMVSCPLCKRRKSLTRNYMAETLLEQVPLPCRYHIEGCRETVQRSSKLMHEQTCMYRMYQCPYHLCNQTYSYQNMYKHFKKVHKSLLHEDGYSVTQDRDEFSLSIYKDQLLPHLIHAVHIPQWGLFFIRQTTVRFTSAIFVQVMRATPDIPNLCYHVEVCDHHDCRKQSYRGHVSPLGRLVREIIEMEEYLAVTDLLVKSVKKTEPLKISLTVWPCTNEEKEYFTTGCCPGCQSS